MITFLTLFLGLASGVHPVELAVDGEVARVELRLDGDTVAVAERPPWRFDVDFGHRLVPHRLEAVAFDAAGERVGGAVQRVNLELSTVGARLVLERDAGGRAVAVRPVARALRFAVPSGVELHFDGRPLPVEDPARVRLPPHDGDVLHFVQGRLAFPDGTEAAAELAFGGVYSDEVSTENTAVAVEVEEGHALREPADARNLLQVAGRPALPLAVESEGADLVVVVDGGAAGALARLGRALEAWIRQRRRLAGPGRSVGEEVLGGAGLRDSDRLFFIGAAPERVVPAGVVHYIFESRLYSDDRRRGLSWAVTHFMPEVGPGPQRLADAVAVAALHAAAGKRPRAVLLVLADGLPGDGAVGPPGLHTPEQALQLLEAVRVPLFVWYVGTPPARNRRGTLPAPPREELVAGARRTWGEVADVAEVEALVELARDLRDRVGRQRVVWVDGPWLPREVTLAPGVAGVRFVDQRSTRGAWLECRPSC